HHRFETAFVDVIAQTNDQRFEYFFFVNGRVGHDRLGLVGVNDEKVLGELFAARNEAARRIENQTATVEYQFVVAADQIAVNQRRTRLYRQALQHVETGLMFAQMPRRRRDVKDEPGSAFDELDRRVAAIPAIAPEIVVVPDVFADRQADFLSIELDRRVLRGRFKITVFVENVVGGQQGLGARGQNFSIPQQRDRVGRFASGPPRVFADVPDQQTGFARRRSEPVEQRQIIFDETGFEQQVARRVARRGQFGKNHHLDPRPGSAT